MLEFIYQYEDKAPRVHLTMSPESTLDEVLENFELFLKAAGYCFDGQIDIIGPDITDVPLPDEGEVN